MVRREARREAHLRQGVELRLDRKLSLLVDVQVDAVGLDSHISNPDSVRLKGSVFPDDVAVHTYGAPLPFVRRWNDYAGRRLRRHVHG